MLGLMDGRVRIMFVGQTVLENGGGYLRSAEKGPKHILEDDEGDRYDNTDYTRQTDGGLVPPTAGYFADSADNLLLTGTENDGAPYQSPNEQYDFGGPQNRGV